MEREHLNMSPGSGKVSIISDSLSSNTGKIYINSPMSPTRVSINSFNQSPYLNKVYINPEMSPGSEKISLNFDNGSTSSDKLSINSRSPSSCPEKSIDSINIVQVSHAYDDARDEFSTRSDDLSRHSDSTRNVSELSRSMSPSSRDESRDMSPPSRSLSPSSRNESSIYGDVTSNGEELEKSVSPTPSAEDKTRRKEETRGVIRRELKTFAGDTCSMPRELLPKKNPFIRVRQFFITLTGLANFRSTKRQSLKRKWKSFRHNFLSNVNCLSNSCDHCDDNTALGCHLLERKRRELFGAVYTQVASGEVSSIDLGHAVARATWPVFNLRHTKSMEETRVRPIHLFINRPFDSQCEHPIRGSDPRVATCRGKLQNRRCQLNQEINKELRLRAGAENLFKATHNRKLRETVALELSFVNSNLQLLKQQLATLNSSVELYQNDSKDSVMPMIPLGLKETKEVDFREPFTDFILEHYSEEASQYQDAISDFMDMRQAVRTPVRHATGVALLFRYYNQLYFIDRRFFPPDRSLGIYFEWFDSLTGVPSCQRTVAFEKACILFNMAAIYTQIGAKQDRSEANGLDSAVDSLLRAAGMFRYIHENFTNAPSMDLGPDMLDMLVSLMLAQARECLFEKLVLGAEEECASRERELCDDLSLCLDLCQESQTLAHQYQLLRQKMQAETVLSYVPYSWVSLVHIKTEFYKALSHHHIATGLLNATTPRSSLNATTDRLGNVHGSEPSLPDWCDFSCKNDRNVDGSPAKNGAVINGSMASREEQKIALGKAHLAEALNAYEEALRLQRMCRELKSKASLCRVLKQHHDKAIVQSTLLPDGPDFAEHLDPPTIMPSTKFQLSLTQPDFAQHRVEDLFKSLGPVAIFSAKRHWSAPRLVQLQKSQLNTKIMKHDKQRAERGRVNGKVYQPEDNSYKNGGKVLRNVSLYEKRDRSEDNSSYYYQREIIKSDEKYKLGHEDTTRLDNTADQKKRSNGKLPITRQNGVYINGYNNNSHNDRRNNKDVEPFVTKYNEKNMSANDLHYNIKTDGNRIRIKNGDINGKEINGKNGYFQKSLGAENFGYMVTPKANAAELKSNGNALIRRISSECNLNSPDEEENVHDKNNPSEGFGFSVRGDAPVIIASVEPRSLADLGGMRDGDFIVAIGDRDVKWCPHDEVVRLIKASGESLSVKLVTPMDRNYLKATTADYTDGKISQMNGSPLHKPGSNQGSVSAASSCTTSSNGSAGPPLGGLGGRHSGAKRAPSWNPFRRHNASRDSSSNRGSHSSNVIFR